MPGKDCLDIIFGIVFDRLKLNGTSVDALDIKLLINDTDIEFKQARQIAAMVTKCRFASWGKTAVKPAYNELAKGASAKCCRLGCWRAMILFTLFAYLSAFYSEGMARDRILFRRVHLFVSSMGDHNII